VNDSDGIIFEHRFGHAVTVSDGKLIMTGGRGRNTTFNDVWESKDGEDWDLVFKYEGNVWSENKKLNYTPSRMFHKAISHDDNVILLTGYDGNSLD